MNDVSSFTSTFLDEMYRYYAMSITYYINCLNKNGLYIHGMYPLLYYLTKSHYITMAVYIKLFSINYFYWFGTYFHYLQNPRMNWIKQFIRFTDTGHLATFLPIVFTNVLPVSHNIHFVIMAGYWIGKLAFDMKDADTLQIADPHLFTWHNDLCTYIHHTIPYLFIYSLWKEQTMNRHIVCEYEYSNQSLWYSYVWLYIWFGCIYVPWRYVTGDTVYSILDKKQTPIAYSVVFVVFMHGLVYLSNNIGFFGCIFTDGYRTI